MGLKVDALPLGAANCYVVADGEQSLLDALRLLQQRKGYPDWWLVVDTGEGHYLTASFEALRDRVGKAGQGLLRVPLRDFGPPLAVTASVEQDADVSSALARMNQSGNRLVVTWAGAVVGVLTLDALPGALSAVPPPAAASPNETSPGNVGKQDSQANAVAGERPAGASVVAGTPPAAPSHFDRVEAKAKLTRAAHFVWEHPALRVVGFILVTLLPSIWFLRYDLFPALVPPPPPPMTGEWNVAVAGFADVGTDAIQPDEMSQIGLVFYNRLANDLKELSEQSDILVQARGPDEVGTVTGQTPEERAASAERLAGEIKADVVVYGTVQQISDVVQLQPEFYVAIDSFYAVEEVVGQHAFGAPIAIIRTGRDLPAQINLNRDLARRSEVLSLITRGLGLFFVHDYENALKLFRQANQDSYWSTLGGREVLYLFEGNVANRIKALDDAEKAYRNALAVEPEYARADVGLGSVYYLRSLENVDSAHFAPDGRHLALAADYYQQALSATLQTPSADIPTKVAYGLAQIYLTRWFAGEDTQALAEEHFKRVIENYADGKNPRVQEIASESHARLGLIRRQESGWDAAVEEFSEAIQLSTIPARRGLYWATIADIHGGQGNALQANEAHRSAIAEYQAALLLAHRPAQQAESWAAIAERYEKLGDLQQAIHAMEQAVRLLQRDDKNYAGYAARLEELRQAVR